MWGMVADLGQADALKYSRLSKAPDSRHENMRVWVEPKETSLPKSCIG